MAYQKFPINCAPRGDTGDNGDKIAKSVESVATVAAVTARCTKNEKVSCPVEEVAAPRIWSHPEIMALPVMPCTTCVKFKWGRRPSCARYQTLANPKKGCRCVHYAGRA